MRIILDSKLSVEKNAARYFERAKKAKKKLKGAMKAIAIAEERLKKPEKKQVQKPQKVERKKEWFEHFRWFYSSDGMLCIGGRDATTNETVIKKHTEQGDLVFHTDMAGSPFIVVKAESKEISTQTKEEAAVFTGSFSRAWKQGLGYIDVFYVKPDQVTKQAQAGEFLGKGAFMIRGHTEYLKPELELCMGRLPDGKIMVAKQSAIEANCPH
ncbi:DUF814 domain-containing protein, partial [Candidatus Woesearchaeota archaeon]|nr:DUF814 domain-containing protein [Candidatus Woesearchaeota archaeon]